MSEIDTIEATREWIDTNTEPATIMGQQFDASRVLEECDPIAFHQVELDLIDSRVKSGDWFEWADESIHDESEDDDDDEN